METEERKLPEDCGRDDTEQELEETIRGLRRLLCALPVPRSGVRVPARKDSWVRAYIVLLEKEKRRRKGEL